MGVQALAFIAALCLGLVRPGHGLSTAECQALTDHYLEKHHKEAAPYTGSNLLYFLHVPRTAGRTFHSCLLKMGVHPARRCPKAYDHLRLTNMSTPNCFLLSSHDDFSVVSMLPADAAVITQLRDPLDRFISAYEFAIEVASRSLRRPRNVRKRVGKIATEDVWPWSYLIPFFAEDMKPKVAAAQAEPQPEGGRWVEVEQDGERWFYNKALNESRWNLTDQEAAAGGGALPMLDPYDNHLVMSLKDFAQHPIATELLHNGAAFQVLGITNYSHWGDAGAFRGCLRDQPHLMAQMVEVAEARVRRFSHVGTTDRLFESAASALVSMGLSVDSPAYSGGDDDVAGHGGTRRRFGEGAGGGGGGSGEGGGEGGARRVVGGNIAARLQLAAKLVREARQRLQVAQRELVDAQRAGSEESAVEALRIRVDRAREDLIHSQDKLADIRDQLPEGMGGRGLAGTDDDNGGAAAAARRRRLMSAESVSDASVDGASQDSQVVVAGEQGEDPGVTGSGPRRRLTSQIEVAQVDAFGNPLDPHFKRIPGTSVGAEFVRCANRAQQRSEQRREQSLLNLATADGRHVMFSKAARRRIPPEVLALIRSHNTMDTALHKVGLGMLDTRLAEQKDAGLFRELPKVADKRPKPSSRLVKPERGAGEL